MKSTQPEINQRYMLLFKIDAKNLYNRISNRQNEYIEIFSLKRSRSVFKDIFENRYAKASAFDLSHCPAEVMEALDQFYTRADELYWYLKYTQDMPNTIEDEVSRKVARLGKLYEQLCLYVDAELSGVELDQDPDFKDIPSDDIHYDSFVTEGEKDEEQAESDFIQPEHFPDPDELSNEDDKPDFE
ncbi:MAG: hypothetical protein KC478_07220 [Bacteriovoracaceae bacterium]|nr:hypothetical protein [Bacteriovoracaceae bacterium]